MINEFYIASLQSSTSLFMPHHHIYRAVVVFNSTLEQSELYSYVRLIVFLRLYVKFPRTSVKD